MHNDALTDDYDDNDGYGDTTAATGHGALYGARCKPRLSAPGAR